MAVRRFPGTDGSDREAAGAAGGAGARVGKFVSSSPRRVAYVCTLLHRAEEVRKIHYFAVENWEGEILNHEAEALLWLSFDELDTFDLVIDRVAVREYLRHHRRGR